MLLTICNVFIANKFRESIGEYAQGSLPSIFLNKHKDVVISSPESLIKIATKIISLLSAQEMVGSINSILGSILNKHLSKIINNKYSDILLENDNIEKILSKNKNYGKILLDNLKGDIHELSNGAQGLNNFAETYLELLNAIENIKNYAPEIPALFILNTLVTQKAISVISATLDPLYKEQATIKGKFTRLESTIIENYKQLNIDNQKNGKKFLEKKLELITQKEMHFFLKSNH